MLEIIITSSILILIVLALRFLLRNKLSPTVIYALWAVVALRLLLPFNFIDSRASVMNLFVKQENTNYIEVQNYQYSDLTEPVFDEPVVESADTEIIQNTAMESNHHTDKEINVRKTMSASTIALIIWLTGIAAVLGYTLSTNIHFNRMLKAERRPLCGVHTPLQVYEVKNISSPCLYGIFNPAIYLTDYAADDQQRAGYVITHELMHYHHLDHIWAVVRVLCCAVYWFNPLVWLAAYLSRQDSELACDNAVINKVGEEYRLSYGRTLVDMVSVGVEPSDLVLTSTTMSSGNNSIKERIVMIKKYPKTILWAAIAVAITVLVAVIVTFTGAAPKNRDQVFTDTNVNETITSSTYPDLLAEYRTSYNTLNVGRSENLELAAELINGTVLQPGEEFSFNEIVGERIAERGFVKAKGYAFETSDEDYGIGISQTATTLFNTAFKCGFEITEQHPHMYTVNYTTNSDGTQSYGNDALVEWGSYDLRFVNTKQNPVMINIYCSDGVITARIYGTDDGIRADFVFAEEETVPFNVIFRKPAIDAVDQSGQEGRSIKVSRVIYENGIEKSSEPAYFAVYLPLTDIYFTDELPFGCEYDKEYSYYDLTWNENNELYVPEAIDQNQIWENPAYQYLLKDVPLFDTADLISCSYYPEDIVIAEQGLYNLEGLKPEIDLLVMIYDNVSKKLLHDYLQNLHEAGFTYYREDDGSNNEDDICVFYNAPRNGVGVQVCSINANDALIIFFPQRNGCYGYNEPVPKG